MANVVVLYLIGNREATHYGQRDGLECPGRGNVVLSDVRRGGARPPHRAQADNYGVSAACGRNYEPNVIRIDGDVNTPVALTVPQLEALPGQETLNITYLNHLGVAETFSETGPTLWTVLSVAAGGIKVPLLPRTSMSVSRPRRRPSMSWS